MREEDLGSWEGLAATLVRLAGLELEWTQCLLSSLGNRTRSTEEGQVLGKEGLVAMVVRLADLEPEWLQRLSSSLGNGTCVIEEDEGPGDEAVKLGTRCNKTEAVQHSNSFESYLSMYHDCDEPLQH